MKHKASPGGAQTNSSDDVILKNRFDGQIKPRGLRETSSRHHQLYLWQMLLGILGVVEQWVMTQRFLFQADNDLADRSPSPPSNRSGSSPSRYHVTTKTIRRHTHRGTSLSLNCLSLTRLSFTCLSLTCRSLTCLSLTCLSLTCLSLTLSVSHLSITNLSVSNLSISNSVCLSPVYL